MIFFDVIVYTDLLYSIYNPSSSLAADFWLMDQQNIKRGERMQARKVPRIHVQSEPTIPSISESVIVWYNKHSST